MYVLIDNLTKLDGMKTKNRMYHDFKINGEHAGKMLLSDNDILRIKEFNMPKKLDELDGFHQCSRMTL